MKSKNVLLATTALTFALISQTVLADGNLACTDITQVRYMLEKYASMDATNYCVRAYTLADSNPHLREEVIREGNSIARKHGIATLEPGCPKAVAAVAPAPVIQQQAYVPVQQQQYGTYYQTQQQVQQPVYQERQAAGVVTTQRSTGSHAGILVGSSLLWGGLGLLAAGGTAAALVSGGGLGGSSTSIPPSDECDTDEFNAQYGLRKIGALSTCQRGHTGDGVVVGLIDTGVDVNHFELEGRIADNGGYDFVNDLAGQPATSQLNGHGTQVGGVIVANRNFVGMHGVAYNAKILPVRVFDRNGAAIADFSDAIDYLTNKGVKIFNGSYGPDDAWHTVSESRGHQIITTADINEGQAYLRAAAAGALLVFPTGNELAIAPTIGLNPTGPGFLPFIRPANHNITSAAAGAYRDINGNVLSNSIDYSALEDNVIAVAGIDRNMNIVSYSNRCGVAKDWCMVAPADDIFTITLNDQYTTVDGTSYAAPHVSGAAAVLKQAFPSLTMVQIRELLFDTATDLGATGVDEVYGHGLLNLELATRPVGTSGIATTGTVDGFRATLTGTSLSFGAAFGLNANAVLSDTAFAFFDKYDRPFFTAFGDMIKNTERNFDVDKAVSEFGRASARTEILVGNNVSVGFQTESKDTNVTSDGPSEDSFGSDLRAFSMTQKFSDSFETSVHYKDQLSLSLGFSEFDRDAHERSINKDSMANPYAGFADAGYASIIKTSGFGGTVRVAGFYGSNDEDTDALNFGSQAELGYNLEEGQDVFFSLGTLFEENRVLGSKGEGAFAFGTGTTTVYAGAGTKLALDGKTSFRAAAYAGMTSPSLSDNSLIKEASDILTSAFNAGVERRDLNKKGDVLSFGVAQPLRVESGSLGFAIPVARSLGNKVFSNNVTQSLAADGRELDFEVGYSLPMADDTETLNVGALYRFDAGHVSGNNDALGVIRWSKSF